ncbi:MAG TPA: hypothetical protein PLF13_04365 [candidate division Zixibacteria bacterium]|nr:hypothetical protein [candidate division Zixibacteria bacterium]
MPFEEKIVVTNEIVEVTLTGRVTSNDLPRGGNFFDRYVQRCNEENTMKLLIDLSGLSLIVDQGDRMKAGLDAAEFKDMGLRLVLVLRKGQISDERYFETIASTRGASAITAESVEEARAWLNAEESDSKSA